MRIQVRVAASPFGTVAVVVLKNDDDPLAAAPENLRVYSTPASLIALPAGAASAARRTATVLLIRRTLSMSRANHAIETFEEINAHRPGSERAETKGRCCGPK